jgi:hypothetical protein
MAQVVPVEEIDQRLVEIAQQMNGLAHQLRDLGLERTWLQRLRERAVDFKSDTAAARPEVSPSAPAPTKKLPTKQAIMYVAERLSPIRPSEIVKRAEEIVDTDSKDARKLLYSAVSSMIRSGRLVKAADGTVTVGRRPTTANMALLPFGNGTHAKQEGE